MGLPTLVLLPGIDGSGVLFRPLIEALPAEVKTIIVRYPDDPSAGYAELLPLVLSSCPKGSKFVILGESFSGPMALFAAATKPEGIAGVVLAATFIRNPHPYIPPWMGRLVPSVALRLFPSYVKYKMLLAGYGTPGLRALAAEALSQVSAPVLAHRLRCVQRIDASNELASCHVPILCLHGSRDFVVPGWNAATIHRLLPSAHIVELRAPHMVLQVQAQTAAQEIESFMRSL